MCAGTTCGSSSDEVPAAVPQVVSAREQVVHLVRASQHRGPDSARCRSTHPDCLWFGSRFTTVTTRLPDVAIVLAVADDLGVIGRVEDQAPVRLQSRVLVPDAVDPGDEVAQVVRAAQRPLRDLVLLRIEVLLLARRDRLADAQFEGRAVDAVAGPERGGENQPGHEPRPAAPLEELGQDVRRVRPEVRAEELADLRLRQFGEVLGQLGLGVPPGEVGVRLGEPELRQPVHHLRPGERLGQEDRPPGASPSPRRSSTPRTGTPWCAGYRRGRSSRPGRSRRRRHRPAPARALASPRTRSRWGRCPGTSSAGSRRTGSTRPAGGGTTPDAP